MAAAGRNGPHGEPFIWILRHSRPPVMLLCPGTSRHCSSCRHGRCRHRIDADCGNPCHGSVLVMEMPIGNILFRRWKKKKQIAVEIESKYTALEDFLLLTERLKKEEWDTQLAQKKNFSDLDHAVKRFYERKLHQPFTRLTTDELALQLKQYVLNEPLISIIQTLRLGDAVKFAKFNAGKDECIEAVIQMETIIRKSDTELNPDA